MSSEMRAEFQAAEAAQAVGPRARALAKLRELIYCARPKLMTFWQRLDAEGQGVAPRSVWAQAMRACVIADEDFPWTWLMPIMLPDTGSPLAEKGGEGMEKPWFCGVSSWDVLQNLL